jgi:hypothetical protein
VQGGHGGDLRLSDRAHGTTSIALARRRRMQADRHAAGAAG